MLTRRRFGEAEEMLGSLYMKEAFRQLEVDDG